MSYKHLYKYHQLLEQILICLLAFQLAQCQQCSNPTGKSKPTQQPLHSPTDKSKPTQQPLYQKPNDPLPINKLDEKIVAGIKNADLKKAIKDLQEGKQINLSQEKYTLTPTLITLAVREASNQVPILEYLLSYYQNSKEDLKQKINQTDSLNQTALRVAIKTNQPEVVKLLLENHADPYHGENSESYVSAITLVIMNPFNEMIKYPNLDILKLLVRQDNCNLPCNSDGETPLQLAIYYIDKDTIEYLLTIGADPFVAGSKKHPASPILKAMKSGRLDIIRLFFEKGKVNCNTVLDTATEQTPLHIAVWQYVLSRHDQESKKELRGIIEYLLGIGADKDKKDKAGKKPADYATRSIKDLINNFKKQ